MRPLSEYQDDDRYSLEDVTRRDWVHVSRETFDRIAIVLDAFAYWSKAHNLVGPAERKSLIRRHVLDSLQLVEYVGAASRWVDLGSGSGFPGLVIAAAAANDPEAHVTLVESIEKKCAYLRYASRKAGLPTEVVTSRIETVQPTPVDVVTARALAPLDQLLDYAHPWLKQGSRGVFLKGQSAVSEIDKASQSWDFNYTLTSSQTDSLGVILEVSEVRRVT